MSEITMFEAQKKKLEGLCEEHNFTYRFRKDSYPISLTIRPTQGTAQQLSLLEEADGQDYISPNASMTWVFIEDVIYPKIEGGTFTISDILYRKFTTIFRKMVLYWQQYVFRFLITHGSVNSRQLPNIADAEEDIPQDLPDDPDEDPEDEPEDLEEE